jgi:hypothetical protein
MLWTKLHSAILALQYLWLYGAKLDYTSVMLLSLVLQTQGLWDYVSTMTLTSYDNEDFFAILNYLILRNHDCRENVLTWSSYNAHSALKSSEKKSAVTWSNQELKFLYLKLSQLKNQCHKHTGFNKKICTNLFCTCMPQSHILFKKQDMEKVPNG